MRYLQRKVNNSINELHEIRWDKTLSDLEPTTQGLLGSSKEDAHLPNPTIKIIRSLFRKQYIFKTRYCERKSVQTE